MTSEPNDTNDENEEAKSAAGDKEAKSAAGDKEAKSSKGAAAKDATPKKPSKGGIDAFTVIMALGVAAALAWAGTLIAQGLSSNAALDASHSSKANQGAEYAGLHAKWQAELTAKGDQKIPIDLAMEIVKNELRANPGASAVPSVGAHDKPTLPPQWGFPGKDSFKLQPPAPAPDEATPGEEAKPNPNAPAPAPVSPGKDGPTKPAPAKPAPAAPAKPAPAAPAKPAPAAPAPTP